MDPVPEERDLPWRIVETTYGPRFLVCQALRKETIDIMFPRKMFDIDAEFSFSSYRDLNCVHGMR